jgi:hypothetical protein
MRKPRVIHLASLCSCQDSDGTVRWRARCHPCFVPSARARALACTANSAITCISIKLNSQICNKLTLTCYLVNFSAHLSKLNADVVRLVRTTYAYTRILRARSVRLIELFIIGLTENEEAILGKVSLIILTKGETAAHCHNCSLRRLHGMQRIRSHLHNGPLCLAELNTLLCSSSLSWMPTRRLARLSIAQTPST